jgi:phosphoribosylformylglycinamidine (FGAM) synthase-like enzyme
VAVYPTPTVGMVGIFEDVARRATLGIKRERDALVLVGDFRPDLGGSEYLEVVHGRVEGAPPAPKLASEKVVSDAVRRAVSSGVVDTAHDLSTGGLAVALSEMALGGGIGAEIQLPPDGRHDVALFGEVGGCVLLAVPEERLKELEEVLEEVRHIRIGRTGGERLRVSGLLDLGLDELRTAYERDLFERHTPEGGHLG